MERPVVGERLGQLDHRLLDELVVTMLVLLPEASGVVGVELLVELDALDRKPAERHRAKVVGTVSVAGQADFEGAQVTRSWNVRNSCSTSSRVCSFGASVSPMSSSE